MKPQINRRPWGHLQARFSVRFAKILSHVWSKPATIQRAATAPQRTWRCTAGTNSAKTNILMSKTKYPDPSHDVLLELPLLMALPPGAEDKTEAQAPDNEVMCHGDHQPKAAFGLQDMYLQPFFLVVAAVGTGVH